MRLKMGSLSWRDRSITAPAVVAGQLVRGGDGLAEAEAPRLSESKSDARDPTGEGESSSNLAPTLEPTSRLLLLLLFRLLLQLMDGKRDEPKKALPPDDAWLMDAGENGLPGNAKASSEPKNVLLIDVGDSLSDEGGEGESAVEPPLPSWGKLKTARPEINQTKPPFDAFDSPLG